MPPEIIEPIVNGLTRVINAYRQRNPGPPTRPTSTTPPPASDSSRAIRWTRCRSPARPARRRARNSYPWNDSSAFGAFSLDKSQPYTVVAYLEKSGYGAKAAAPVVKCIFTALAGEVPMDAVLPSDPLDLNSLVPAPPTSLADSTCMPAAVDARD